MLSPTTINNLLNKTISEAESTIEKFVYNPGADMTRHRKCTFESTIKATLCFAMNRTNTELINYFGLDDRKLPSKSAFTQQRRKLNPELFPFLFETFNKKIPCKKRFKGYRLIAADGSDINLPKDCNDTVYRIDYPNKHSDGCYYQLHLNALFDICEKRYTSLLIQPSPEQNEYKAFQQMVLEPQYDDKSIFIADRGYPSLDTLAFMIENHRHFIFRATSPSTQTSMLRNIIPEDTELDRVIEIGVSRNSKYIKLDKTRFKHIRGVNDFYPIPVDDHKTIYYMRFRVVSIPVNDGSLEYIITDLTDDQFRDEDLRELYHMRWDIETSFRQLKYPISLIYFHSVNRELIIQELYAKMILFNFASLLWNYVEIERLRESIIKSRKYRYQASFDYAVTMARFLIKGRVSNKKIKALLLKHLTPIRMGPSKPRNMLTKRSMPLISRA